MADRPLRIREIFDAVVDVPPSDRASQLDTLCGDDVSLRDDVVSLLACPRPDVSPASPPPRPQEEIEQKLSQLTAILNNIPDIAWLKDRESRFIVVNGPFGRACGRAPEELVGKTDFDIWPRALAEGYRSDDARVMASRQGRHVEERLISADGQESWIETIKTPIFGAGGEVIGTTGIARDITDRKRAEEALRDSEERYRLLFEQAIDGIGLADAETGRIIDCNQALLDMVERERAEVVGQPQKILHPPEENAGDVSASFRDHRSTAAGRILQAELVTAKGTRRTVEIKSAAFELKGRKVLQGIFRDLSERRRADQEKQASRDILHTIARAQSDFISEGNPRDLFARLLQKLLDLTGSEYGFIGEVLRSNEGLPYLKTHAITDISWSAETRRFYADNAPRGMEFSNLDTLFGEVMKTRRPVVSNSPSTDPRRGGLPEGHPLLGAFLGLPFDRGGEMVGMVGIANRPGGYDDEVVRYLEPLLATCAIIIDALRNEDRRRRSEEALRHSERLLREAQSIAHVGSWRRDLTTGRLTWTEEVYQCFGWAPEEALDYDEFMRRVHPDDRERLRPAQVEALEGRADLDIEYRIVRPNGDVRWLHERSRAIRDAQGRLMALEGIVHDITERRQAEAEKIEFERQLLHAQKLESLGVLAGGIAHDFNNLLMAILGNLDLALPSMTPGSDGRERVERAIAASYRAADLAQQMLAYSGKGKFLIKPVNLGALLEESGHLLRAVLPKPVTLVQHLEDDLPLVQADAAQAQQVIMNLITNAAESLGGGEGTIRIAIGSRDYDEAALDGSRLKERPSPGRFVFLGVEDSGCGMDADTQERLFDPFFTTKFTGRGLGMSVVLGVVRAHGGAIFVDSAPGRGSSVTVLFPVAAQALVPEEVVRERGSDRHHLQPEKRNGTILLVDDEEYVRNVTAAMLTQLGFRVVTAANGREAVEVFKENVDQVDCVIVDWSMPGMDGLRTVESLSRIRKEVPAILSSGYTEQGTIPASGGPGPVAFLPKPYSLKDLREVLGMVLPQPR